MAVGNVVFCAAFAVFVLYAAERLGLSELGYGVLLVAFAVGGLLGTLVAPALIRHVGASLLLRAGLLVEVALHATLALTRALERYGLWKPSYHDRIVPIPGDIAKPRLGLGELEFRRLAREVDTVIHNAAHVNFLYPFEMLKKDGYKVRRLQ